MPHPIDEEDDGPYSGPFGARILQRVADDGAGLTHEYDELLRHTEDEKVKNLVTKAICRHLKSIDEIRSYWFSNPRYKSLPLSSPALTPLGPDESVDDMEDGFGDDEERWHKPGDLSDVLDADEQQYPDELEDLDAENPEYELLAQEPQDNVRYAHKIHKDFARALKSAADFLDGLREEDEDKNEEPDDLSQFFDPLATRKRKSFSREQQMESRSRAGDLDNYATKINDPDVLDKVQEAIDLLRGIVEARQRHDSTEPLEPHELDQITANAKSLRSILDGKRGKFPSNDLKRTGHKSLDAMCKDVEKQTKALTSLQTDLDRLTRLL